MTGLNEYYFEIIINKYTISVLSEFIVHFCTYYQLLYIENLINKNIKVYVTHFKYKNVHLICLLHKYNAKISTETTVNLLRIYQKITFIENPNLSISYIKLIGKQKY